MKVLVTGGAGFIGRWVVADLLARGHQVLAVDNLAQGDEGNLAEFAGHPSFLGFERGDVRDGAACQRWLAAVDAVAHLAASISVQDSIDDPARTFLGEAPVPYPSYTDPDKKLADALGASVGLPDTAFYDRNGKLVYLKQGPYAKDSELEADVKRYALKSG